jgi:BASS family bile acid:Na+ symporter
MSKSLFCVHGGIIDLIYIPREEPGGSRPHSHGNDEYGSMQHLQHLFFAASHLLHHYFLRCLLASYVLAGLFPEPGLAIRNTAWRDLDLLGEDVTITLPMLLLGGLLFNAGLGVKTVEVRHLFRRPLPLLVGLLANLFVPIAYIFLVVACLALWHNPVEVQEILIGLALVASMPIAGSSTAWSQNANGDLTLSLGLVVGSTVLSPWTTPGALIALGWLAHGTYAHDLHRLATHGTSCFLLLCVLMPSLTGMLVRRTVGEARMAAAAPYLKLVNSMNLLLLGYANASVSLPQMVADPDWDFLGVMLAIVVSLCLLAFGAGYILARLLRSGRAQQASLMFGLGMNNNGTGMVLAAMALANYPRVLLPIIFYNLIQHGVAGVVDFAFFREPPDDLSTHSDGIRRETTSSRECADPARASSG